MEAERELDHLKCELVTQNVGGNSKVKEDLQRRLREWEWKAHILRKMKENYEEAGEYLIICCLIVLAKLLRCFIAAT